MTTTYETDGLHLGDTVVVRRRGKNKGDVEGSHGQIIDFPNPSEVTLLIPDYEWKGSSAISPILLRSDVELSESTL